jgi:hypothetical protein
VGNYDFPRQGVPIASCVANFSGFSSEWSETPKKFSCGRGGSRRFAENRDALPRKIIISHENRQKGIEKKNEEKSNRNEKPKNPRTQQETESHITHAATTFFTRENHTFPPRERI